MMDWRLAGASLSFWLSVLAILTVLIPPSTIIGIRRARNKAPMNRPDYIMISLAILGTLMLTIAVSTALRGEHRPLSTVYLWPFLQYACICHLTQRLRDAALSPHLAWLAVMPVANVILFLAACLPPSRPAVRAA